MYFFRTFISSGTGPLGDFKNAEKNYFRKQAHQNIQPSTGCLLYKLVGDGEFNFLLLENIYFSDVVRESGHDWCAG